MNQVVELTEKSCEPSERQRPEIWVVGVKTNVKVSVLFEFIKSSEGVQKPYSKVLQGYLFIKVV